MVCCAARSHDDALLASRSYDKPVRAYDVRAGCRAVATLQHLDTFDGVAFTPDGRRLLSACRDHVVRSCDTASWAVAGPSGCRC